MAVTVAERDHWTRMIEGRVDKEICRIETAHKSELDRLRADARKRATKKLGLEKLLKDLEQAQKEVEAAQTKLNKIGEAVLKKIGQNDSMRYRAEEVAEEVINKAAEPVLEDLFSGSHAGRQILKLKKEKEELTDAAWLATTGKNLAELYSELTLKLCNYTRSEAESTALRIGRAGK